MNFKLDLISFLIILLISISAMSTFAPSKKPTKKPSRSPTLAPKINQIPVASTFQPSSRPTSRPTSRPSSRPTSHPSSRPTSRPISPVVTKSSMSPSVSKIPISSTYAPTLENQKPGWFTAHYSAGHIAGAIIGSITAAIGCLLCIYNGRNKRAMARDMAAFFGVNNDTSSTAVNNNSDERFRKGEEVYNPMI